MSRPRSKSYGSDSKLLATARLVENLAELLPAIRAHAAAEIALVDGAGSKTSLAVEPSSGVQRSKPLTGKCQAAVGVLDDGLVDCGRLRPCPEHDVPVDLTPVEAAVEARLRIERWLADVEAQCQMIATVTKQALDSGRRLVGTRLAAPERARQCRDGQSGKDGAIEWGDPLCVMPADKAGLCSRHYWTWYRWRKATGGDVAGMFEPAATGRGEFATGADQG